MKISQFVVIFPSEFENRRKIDRVKQLLLLYLELLIYVAVGY